MSEREHMWCGTPLSELSREELIEVINHLGGTLREYQTPWAQEALAMAEVRRHIKALALPEARKPGWSMVWGRRAINIPGFTDPA